MRAIVSFLSGLIFGIGLIVSGMTDPAVVLGFLDVAGDWNPALGLVMAGAVLTTSLIYRFAATRRGPVFATGFSAPSKNSLDPRLISGAILFGVGWGLVGICPGPGLVNLATGRREIIVFVTAMAVGMIAARYRLDRP